MNVLLPLLLLLLLLHSVCVVWLVGRGVLPLAVVVCGLVSSSAAYRVVP